MGLEQQEKIIVLDFGGQYNQLIARRVRDEGVYAEVYASDIDLDKLKAMQPKGLIFTGGPQSVFKEESQHIDKKVFELGIPILGFCYGAQLIAHTLDGKVETAPVSEYGKTKTEVKTDATLFRGVPAEISSWMSHTDYISKVPSGFTVTAHTENCPVAAMEDTSRHIYATQFHPEVQHTEYGKELIHNFLYDVCGCKGDWKMDSFAEAEIQRIRETVGDGKVLLALSGGVDSSVAATLMAKAIGKQLTCVFVDHGLLRKDEGDEVEAVFGPKGKYDLNFIRVNAGPEYFEKLKGVEEPEQKRKIIGEQFIRIFEREAKKIGAVDFLCQGTIYADVVESGLGKGAVIKSHHNVGGLPKTLVYRQPFPGPGLGVRIIGEVTPEKVKIVQEADSIYREEIKKAGLARELSQYFAALTNLRSVGVMGDFRTYDYAVALRAVKTDDFMTAECAEIPFAVLQTVMNRIVNEVKGVNRVFYDLTSKPPGTIELE